MSGPQFDVVERPAETPKRFAHHEIASAVFDTARTNQAVRITIKSRSDANRLQTAIRARISRQSLPLRLRTHSESESTMLFWVEPK